LLGVVVFVCLLLLFVFVCFVVAVFGGTTMERKYKEDNEHKGYCKKNLALFLLTNFSALVSGKEDIS